MTTPRMANRVGKRSAKAVALLAASALAMSACGSSEDSSDTAADDTTTDDTAADTATDDTMTDDSMTDDSMTDDSMTDDSMTDDSMAGDTPADGLAFVSTQFNPPEEAEVFRNILAEGGYDFIASEEGPLIDQVLAGTGEIDLIGALHGTYPALEQDGALTNMIDIYDDLSGDREFLQPFVQAGLLGSEDNLAYVPWAQATYIMVANKQALDYLPDGAEIDSLTYEQYSTWCQAIADGEGSQKCGLPHAGLFHRFLEGYMWPSFTGGMVTNFRSSEAVDMMTWARDSMWPTIHPESINYEFMQEPLQSGEVWVAFDHVARLIDALEAAPDDYVAFPAPAGPNGRGFMPVIAGLSIPADAPDPDGAAAAIDYLTSPEVQAEVLSGLAFFPVIDGVDTSSLPPGVQLEADAVNKVASAPDALTAQLPIGLGERGGEINDIYRSAFDRIVLNGEDIATVLNEEGDKLQALMDETGAPCWAPDPASDGPCQVAAAG